MAEGRPQVTLGDHAPVADDIDVVVLVGGLGTRLSTVVNDRPKPMAEVKGRPFICFLLDQILRIGAKRVILCSGHMGDILRNSLGESYQGIVLVYSHEDTPLGTGGAVRHAMPLVHTNRFLVLNGDSYCDFDAGALFAQHMSTRAGVTIVLQPVSDTSAFGAVVCDDNMRISEFCEKTVSGPGWVSGGIYLAEKSTALTIATVGQVSIERDVFPRLVDERVLYGFRSSGKFIDIGTPDTYKAAADVI